MIDPRGEQSQTFFLKKKNQENVAIYIFKGIPTSSIIQGLLQFRINTEILA